VLEQQTNAYAVLPEGQWRGWRPPLEAPGPAPGTWGEPTPMPDAVTLARLEADMMGKVLALAINPKDALGACAGGPRAGVHGTRLVSFTGLHQVQRNLPIVNTEAQHRLTAPTAPDEGRKAAIERERLAGSRP
jgi:hypothetical protein